MINFIKYEWPSPITIFSSNCVCESHAALNVKRELTFTENERLRATRFNVPTNLLSTGIRGSFGSESAIKEAFLRLPKFRFGNKTAGAWTFRPSKSLTRHTARGNNGHSDSIAATAFALPKRGVHFAGVIAIRVCRCVLRAEGDEIRQNIVTAITAEHWAEGKTGLAYFPPKPPSPEERGRTDITRGLWNFAYWETTAGSPPTMTNGPAIFALLESHWSIPEHHRPCRSANTARILRVHREEESPIVARW